MAIEPLAGHTAAVVHAARLAFESVVVRDDHAAFSRRHQLTRLKTEGSSLAERANPPPLPFRGMRVCAVLDQRNSLSLRKRAQRVEIRWMSSHMDGNDGLGTRGDGRFRQLWIQAVSFR